MHEGRHHDLHVGEEVLPQALAQAGPRLGGGGNRKAMRQSIAGCATHTSHREQVSRVFTMNSSGIANVSLWQTLEWQLGHGVLAMNSSGIANVSFWQSLEWQLGHGVEASGANPPPPA